MIYKGLLVYPMYYSFITIKKYFSYPVYSTPNKLAKKIPVLLLCQVLGRLVIAHVNVLSFYFSNNILISQIHCKSVNI